MEAKKPDNVVYSETEDYNAKLMTYAITSFGLVYSTKYFGYYGIFLILIPVGVVYYFAVKYFEGLEKVK